MNRVVCLRDPHLTWCISGINQSWGRAYETAEEEYRKHFEVIIAFLDIIL
jgi:hypothetical protein